MNLSQYNVVYREICPSQKVAIYTTPPAPRHKQNEVKNTSHHIKEMITLHIQLVTAKSKHYRILLLEVTIK